MAAWAYSAINAQGVELTGELQAADLDDAREQLRAKGLLAQRLEAVGAPIEESRPRPRRVAPKALQVFSRQFATMIGAGLNVVAALVILEEQTDDKALKEVVRELREDVEAGALLSQAVARHPKVFGRLYTAMVEAGEAAGVLDEVLDRVAFQLEKEQSLRRRVKGAMVYPTLVLVFASLVLTGMLLFLVPIFVEIFAQLDGELPILTQWVLAASNALRAWWFAIFPGIGGAIWGFRVWKRSEGGRKLWDRFKLRIPMKIGDVVLKVTLARLSRTFSTLVAAGVDIIKALEITGQTAGNWVVEDALADVRAGVQQGAPVAQTLAASDVFPPMVAQMVKIGEETGELEAMLGKIADFYEDEVDAAVQTLTSIIEPLMMIAVGVVVGIVIISMYLPMFKMLTLIQ